MRRPPASDAPGRRADGVTLARYAHHVAVARRSRRVVGAAASDGVAGALTPTRGPAAARWGGFLTRRNAGCSSPPVKGALLRVHRWRHGGCCASRRWDPGRGGAGALTRRPARIRWGRIRCGYAQKKNSGEACPQKQQQRQTGRWTPTGARTHASIAVNLALRGAASSSPVRAHARPPPESRATVWRADPWAPSRGEVGVRQTGVARAHGYAYVVCLLPLCLYIRRGCRGVGAAQEETVGEGKLRVPPAMYGETPWPGAPPARQCREASTSWCGESPLLCGREAAFQKSSGPNRTHSEVMLVL